MLCILNQVVPERYTAAVHAAALQHAVQAYTAAAYGPAEPDLQQLLLMACQRAWEAGRQQCAQISLTGRAWRD